MKFNLEAAKAWMGGVLATGGPPVAAFIISFFEAATSVDIPPTVEGWIVGALTFALGYVGVYFTPNAKPKV